MAVSNYFEFINSNFAARANFLNFGVCPSTCAAGGWRKDAREDEDFLFLNKVTLVERWTRRARAFVPAPRARAERPLCCSFRLA